MKITIEAGSEVLEELAKKGLLNGVMILERKEVKRRQLSKATEDVLIEKLKELRAYRDQSGSFHVPRWQGELGKWLDKLRQTYAKAPDGYRIAYLREHAPDVLKYLEECSRDKVERAPARVAPFWMSAAWTTEFMEQRLKAPSQASIHPDEVSMAKWLTRWTNGDTLERLKAGSIEHRVACELDALAVGLRSRNPMNVEAAKRKASEWRGGELYEMVASLCLRDCHWMSPTRLEQLPAARESRMSFWPSWNEWKAEGAAWVAKDLRAAA